MAVGRIPKDKSHKVGVAKKKSVKGTGPDYSEPADVLKRFVADPINADYGEIELRPSRVDTETIEAITVIRLDCLRLSLISEPNATPDAVVRRANSYQRFVFGAGPETDAETRAKRGGK
jgi:hypothetical protein